MWVGAEEKADATRCKVLVVEDDPSSRRALTQLLRLRGFEAAFATSVSEAMQQLDWGPCCILLDLMLPDGNGATVLDYVRDHQLPIRVAVTTGASNWQGLLGSSKWPPDALFAKPLDFDRVVEWLNDAS